jgi:hypothetical protein
LSISFVAFSHHKWAGSIFGEGSQVPRWRQSGEMLPDMFSMSSHLATRAAIMQPCNMRTSPAFMQKLGQRESATARAQSF